MDINIVSTSNAPAAIGPYSQGVQAGGITFFPGSSASILPPESWQKEE